MKGRKRKKTTGREAERERQGEEELLASMEVEIMAQGSMEVLACQILYDVVERSNENGGLSGRKERISGWRVGNVGGEEEDEGSAAVYTAN